MIATVGDSFVSIEEFRDTYLDLILYTNKVDSPELRREHARELARRKLFAMAARDNGIKLDPPSLRRVKRAEERALREALFRSVVAPGIREPDDAVLREQFRRVNTQYRVQHIFSESRSVIDSVYTIIGRNPDEFSNVARSMFRDERLASTGGDLGWVHYNQLDPAFEDVAYSTSVGAVSPPFRSGYGWHILQKIDERVRILLTEEDYQRERAWLKKQVIRKEQQIRANNYVNDLMISKHANIDDKIFYFVATEIRTVLGNEQQEPFVRNLSSEEKRQIDLSLSDVKDVVFVTFDGGRWKVEDFIERLDEMPPHLLHRDIVTGFYRVFRDHILVREAKAMGLMDKPTVRVTRRDAEDLYLASLFLSHYTGEPFDPDSAVVVGSGMIQSLGDSLCKLYPVDYNDDVIEAVFEPD